MWSSASQTAVQKYVLVSALAFRLSFFTSVLQHTQPQCLSVEPGGLGLPGGWSLVGGRGSRTRGSVLGRNLFLQECY